jgi:hypothetical protein
MIVTLGEARTRHGYGEIPADRGERRLTLRRWMRRGTRIQPPTRVPALDWPADLYTGDAAMEEIMAVDFSAVWQGGHMAEMHA